MSLKIKTITNVVLGAVLALSTATARAVLVGPSFGVAQMRVQDPDGPTQSKTRLTPGATLILSLDTDTRMMVDVYHQTAHLNGTTQDIGQNVTSTGGHLIFQKQFPVTYQWHPWLGIGAGYAQESFTSRYTVDAQGYLANRYPDRSANPVSVVVNGTTDWTLNRSWRLGATVQYEYPLTSGIAGLSVSLMALYQL